MEGPRWSIAGPPLRCFRSPQHTLHPMQHFRFWKDPGPLGAQCLGVTWRKAQASGQLVHPPLPTAESVGSGPDPPGLSSGKG